MITAVLASPIAHRLNNIWNSKIIMSWDYSTEPPKQHGRSMLIALGCTLLGVCAKVLADDYFNPALLDIDNPDRVKPTSVFMRLVPVRLPVISR